MKKILIVVLMWLYGCPLQGLAAEKSLNFVFIPKSSDQIFWNLVRDGVDQAVNEQGNINITWRGPAHNDDTNSQIRILQAYAKPGVDAILIVPTDRVRLVGAVRAAAALGIKIIVVDSELADNVQVNTVVMDNILAGKLAAKYMVKILNNQGSVMVLRTVAGSASTDERADGFIAYMKENAPRIRIVADAYGGGSAGKLRHSAAEMLHNYDDVDGVFSVNETATDGMLRALRERGMAGKVKFIGFDATDWLLSALKGGEIQGLMVQNPRRMGYVSVKAAVAAVNNKPIKEKIIFTDVTLVTRENMNLPDIRTLVCVRC